MNNSGILLLNIFGSGSNTSGNSKNKGKGGNGGSNPNYNYNYPFSPPIPILCKHRTLLFTNPNPFNFNNKITKDYNGAYFI